MYLCELSLVEYKMLEYRPSLLAAGAYYLAIRILDEAKDFKWKDSYMEQRGQLEESEVR